MLHHESFRQLIPKLQSVVIPSVTISCIKHMCYLRQWQTIAVGFDEAIFMTHYLNTALSIKGYAVWWSWIGWANIRFNGFGVFSWCKIYKRGYKNEYIFFTQWRICGDLWARNGYQEQGQIITYPTMSVGCNYLSLSSMPASGPHVLTFVRSIYIRDGIERGVSPFNLPVVIEPDTYEIPQTNIKWKIQFNMFQSEKYFLQAMMAPSHWSLAR